MMPIQNSQSPDLTKEKSGTEQTVTILLMRLNQSLAELDSQNKFPQTNKPHNRDLYRNVYKDVFELTRLVRATLSQNLLKELSNWRKTLPDSNFTTNAVFLTEKIYDELSESGMIDIRARKTATFPIEFYTNKLIEFK